MNKKGKISPIAVILIVLVIGVVGVLGYVAVSQSVGGGVTPSERCADSTGVLTSAARSMSPTGTAYSAPTITCGVDGGVVTTSVTSGTTTFAVGTALECLISKGDYIDQKFSFAMPCGGKTLDAPLWYSTSDNPTLTWYNDDDNAMSDSHGGSVNQTDLSAGETFTLKLKIQGTSGESSGDGIIVIEFPAVSSGNITSATLDGRGSVAIPSVYTSVNAGSKVFAFEIDAVKEGTVRELPFQVQLTASKDVTGGVYTDWFSKQWFVDDDSTLKYGIQDSDGSPKYENSFDSDFFIN